MECSDGCSQGSSRHSSVTLTRQLRVDLDFLPLHHLEQLHPRERGEMRVQWAGDPCMVPPKYGSSCILTAGTPRRWASPDTQGLGEGVFGAVICYPCIAQQPRFVCGRTRKTSYTTQWLNPHHEGTCYIMVPRGQLWQVHWMALCPTLPSSPGKSSPSCCAYSPHST